jgi:hypothetical protein
VSKIQKTVRHKTIPDLPIPEMIEEVIKMKTKIGLEVSREELEGMSFHLLRAQYRHYYNLFHVRYSD